MTYGVVPTGFNRKPLAVIIEELQAVAVEVFGEDVITTPQSPMGQMIGLFADAVASEWEELENTYQSFDVDQAQGIRLDMLSKLRRLERKDDELDAPFQQRITNQGVPDIRLKANTNRLLEIEGVTWAHAIENDTASTDDLGIPAHATAYAVIGGDDATVGLSIFQMSVPGIHLHGNTSVGVDADGYCQPVKFIRPTDAPIQVDLQVRHVPSSCNCAPPAVSEIVAHMVSGFEGTCGFRNGDTVTEDRIEAEAGRFWDLKIVDVGIVSTLDDEEGPTITHTLFERPVILATNISVTYVE